MVVTLYTIDCPKCKVLKAKLEARNIPCTVITDREIMIDKGFDTTPILEVNNKIYNFPEAIQWIKEQK